MKVSINDQELFTVSAIQKQVIANDIDSDALDADLQRRIQYSVMHKYAQCMKRLRDEWLPKLKANGVQSAPLDDDAFAQLVFSQPNYKDRKAREAEQ